jgi:VWFA-related protein
MGLRKITLWGGAIILAAGGAVHLGFSAARAQSLTTAPTPAPRPPSQTRSTSSPEPRITTRLVRVSVVVRDEHETPVTGLTPDDFLLLDDGRPQAIQHFAVATNQPLDHYTPPLEVDMYSNRLEDHPRISDSATVILLDGLNTRFEDQAYARRQAVKFLQQIHPQDHVAVYTLGRELRVLHDFAPDATGLLAALQTYQGEITASTDESEPRERLGYHSQAAQRGDDMLESFLTFGTERSRDSDKQNQERLTAAALTAIANHLAALPGRKSLVWVSGGFPLEHTSSRLEWRPHDTKSTSAQEIEAALRAVNDAAIAVYPVNADGLMSPGEKLMNLSSSGALHLGLGGANRPDLDIMKSLAEGTGGKAFLLAGDIFGSIRQAIDDSENSYELGYYAATTSSRGSPHALAVSVRRIGVQVRARHGYSSLPDPDPTPLSRKALLANIARSPLDATRLVVRVRVKAANLPGAQKLNARIDFRPQEISFAEKDARWIGKVDAVLVQLDAKNQIVEASDETFDLDFSPARFQQILRNGISYSKDIPIQPDATVLRVILRDAMTTATGSIAIPLLQYFPRVNEAN